MTCAAIIVAAGRGVRAGGTVAKQWQPLCGKRVIDHTLAAFLSHPQIAHVVLVLHADDIADAEFPGVACTTGGADRAASVRAGLAALDDAEVTRVLIHDVARPCVTARTITDVIAALETSAGAAPALPVTDALWTGSHGHVTGTQDRSGLYRAQTPQGFDRAAITAAHAAYTGQAADDVEVARAAGLDVAIVAGDEDNLKITHPGDFDRAARIIRGRNGHQTG
ncbi:2-C-methyl-D-erythritol 4-phosphate cytidylyltransferase [Pseudosulfitobacter koreensis]|uniref:2-C-methyl-D-erythritol 4-phosphate cytidylyltransferase n=1 Tax=Pseudosulfitobacter koreensis TaxID=2968472 RepID=A0ABT1Z299_9RHOB|nr:2-C-methyl-D-erythritol 4-phosphate cytidylyltransferase [Pseudosulfitobacter koreense]MCR8827243.1 2-C-methyl-D-erythritol 4-phosphate cytidylyltransferase [Pseudosulfitobacter koreense]